MSLLDAIILGIIQGVAEFLPISSSAHLILARVWFDWSFPTPSQELFFDLALHLGTAAAILLYFWRDLSRYAVAFLRTDAVTDDRKMARNIIVGSIPAIILGGLLGHRIEDYFRENVFLICVFLIAIGLLMGVAEKWGPHRRAIESLSSLDALLIGCAQALALFPGFSRSGITIIAALFLGFRREAAARFSFLLSFPIILLAAGWSLLPVLREGIPSEIVMSVMVGMITSALVGYACIALLLRFLRTRTLWPFVVYRTLVGLLTIFFRT